MVSRAPLGQEQGNWSFHCAACGKCCNSPPQLSVPELFAHQHTFVGALAVRRVRRLRAGQIINGVNISTEDCAAAAELAARVLYPAQDAGYDFSLATQGFDYPSLDRCPALSETGHCSLQDKRKPAVCGSVPLDGLVPDRLQHLLLSGRSLPGETEAPSCIASGKRAGFAPVTSGGMLVHEEFRLALERRRSDLANDKRWWGSTVIGILQKDLFDDPAAVSRIPFDGFLAVAPAPVLMVLAEVSDRCRERCIQYLEAQAVLIDRKIGEALRRHQASERAVTNQLRSFLLAASTLRRVLENSKAAAVGRAEDVAAIEAWLGLREPVSPLQVSQEAVQTWLSAGKGELASGVTRSLHATVKPGGSACNLNCSYCYYLHKQGLLNQQTPRMNVDLLEKFIVDYIASQDGDEIAFTWHGGEPTLLGIDYFRTVVELQKKHTPPGRRISNDLQTNGTVLDDEWCSFLAENRFLVGLSIDGPQNLHDANRPTKGGASSFSDVVAAARRLKWHGVIFSTLTTVNATNAPFPLEVYRFLRDEIGARYLQFIPCVEPVEFRKVAPGYRLTDGAREARPKSLFLGVTDWSVAPGEWGGFLTVIFDEWLSNDRGKVRINLFESLLAQLKGQPALICSSSPFCGKNVAVEHDGRVYACDHFVYPQYEIGNIAKQPLAEMVFSLKQLKFGLEKYNSLPDECRSCGHLKLCWGECPRTRVLPSRSGEGRLSYLCGGWKRFFDHAVQLLTQAKPAQTPKRQRSVETPPCRGPINFRKGE